MSTKLPRSADLPVSPKRSRSPILLAAALLGVVGLATACGGGPGSQEDLAEMLARDGDLTVEEADCIAEQVFDEYGDDEDALGKLSAAPDMEFLESEEGVPGFDEFFDSAVRSCLQVGPAN